MEITNQRYLLSIDYKQTDNPDQPGKRTPELRYVPSIAEAMLELFSRPTDSFHPLTAKARNHSQYINYADVFDLETGNRLLTVMPHDILQQPPRNESAVYLMLDSGTSLSNIISPSVLSPDYQNPLHGLETLAIMEISQNREYLYPNIVMSYIVSHLADKLVHEDHALFTQQYAAMFHGYDNGNIHLTENGLQMQPISLQHYYPTSQEAFAKMLLTPPAAFDRGQAFQQDLPYSFESAVLVRNVPESKEMAAMFVLPTPSEPDLYELSHAGIYIKVEKGIGNINNLLGVDLTSIKLWSPAEREAKFGYYNLEDPPQLKLHSDYNLILSKLAEKFGPDGPQLDYLLKMRSRPNEDELLAALGQGVGMADNMLFLHTNNLQAAMTQMLNPAAEKFDWDTVKEYGYNRMLSEATLTDKSGKLLMEFVIAKNEPGFDNDGLFLKINPELIANPAAAAMQLDLLSHGSKHYMQEKDGFLYSQVGLYTEAGLVSLAAYNKLQLQISTTHLKDFHQQNPQARAYIGPNVSPEDKYIVRAQYEVQRWGDDLSHQPAGHFYYHKGFRDESASISYMQSFRHSQFTAKSNLSQDIPFTIKEIAIFDREQNLVVAKGKPDMEGAMEYRIMKSASAEMTAVFNKEILPLMSMYPELNKLKMPPDDPSLKNRAPRPRLQSPPPKKDRGKGPATT